MTLRSWLPEPEDRLFAGVFAALLLLAAALALVYDFAPLLDWPEHCSDAAVTAHFHDPRWAVARYYDHPVWFVPYHVFRWIQAGLGAVFGWAGLRAALLIQLWGIPLLAYLFCRQNGHDRFSALAAFTVTVEANLLWGFLPYVTGIVFMLGGIALFNGWLIDRKDWRLVALALLSIVVFFSHAVPELLLCTVCGSLALVAFARRRLRLVELFAVAGALLPGFALLVTFLSGPSWAGDPAALSTPVPILSFAELKSVLSQAGPLSGLTLMGNGPLWWFGLALLGLAAGAVWELRQRRRAPLAGKPPRSIGWTLFAILALLTITLPAWWKGESLGGRIFSLAAFGFLLAIPFRGTATSARWPVRATMILAAFGSLITAHVSFYRYNRDNQPLRRIIATLPTGATVAYLPYGYGPEGYALPLYIHLGGYIHAQRGGYASFSFGHVPYKKELEQFGLSKWIWAIANDYVLPNSLTAFYDYVVVRKGPKYRGNPFAPLPKGKKPPLRVLAEGDYELWETLNEVPRK